MKLAKVFIVMAVVLVVFFSVQIAVILNNNESLKNINVALRSNIDAVLVEANIRGFSASMHTDIHDASPTSKIQKAYMSYEDSVEKFREIVSEIESGESKRTQTEISEELQAHKKTLSDAQKLSDELKLFLAEQKQNVTDSLFDDVFESSTVSLNLDTKHSEILKDADDELLRFVSNTTFLMIALEILIVMATLFITLSKIITPVIKLTKTIEKISTGKLDMEIEEKGRKNEIGDLARAFDRTVVSLKLAMKKAGLEAPKIAEILKKQAKQVTEETLLESGLMKAKKKNNNENKAEGGDN